MQPSVLQVQVGAIRSTLGKQVLRSESSFLLLLFDDRSFSSTRHLHQQPQR